MSGVGGVNSGDGLGGRSAVNQVPQERHLVHDDEGNDGEDDGTDEGLEFAEHVEFSVPVLSPSGSTRTLGTPTVDSLLLTRSTVLELDALGHKLPTFSRPSMHLLKKAPLGNSATRLGSRPRS